jgi:hypothetical protein
MVKRFLVAASITVLALALWFVWYIIVLIMFGTWSGGAPSDNTKSNIIFVVASALYWIAIALFTRRIDRKLRL